MGQTPQSYGAGERGRNRVRVFERPNRKDTMLEFYEHGADGALRKRRVSLARCSRETAEAKAIEVAATLVTETKSAEKPTTVQALFDIYVREVTPTKGWGSQVHDRMCAELFRRAFGADRPVATLSIRDVERFVGERRAGRLRPASREKRIQPVGDRQVQYDLQTLHAVLNWAVLARDEKGRELLVKNPLKGLALPRERNPTTRSQPPNTTSQC